ncbi:MAG: GNAT family N-acetyltransferase [Rhodomicrobiaceae bacterium]
MTAKAPSGYVIRKPGPEQADDAVRLLDALLPDDWREGPMRDAASMAETLRFPGTILIGAWDVDQRPAGYVSGLVMPALTQIGETAMLDDLFVAAPARGKGLGSALVRAFRKAALARRNGPLVMWGATATDNAACDRAFRAAGGSPDDGEIFREYRWPAEPDEGTGG